MYKIRKKELKDCETTSYVVTKSLEWNVQYKGIVNEKFLKELWINSREAFMILHNHGYKKIIIGCLEKIIVKKSNKKK